MEKFAVIVLAAGLSNRMGTPKMVLPWGDKTVIEYVVCQLAEAGVEDVVVITGSTRQPVEEALKEQKVRTVFNPDYANGEMLVSLQVGIRSMQADTTAFLLALGDQPQIQSGIIGQILAAYSTFSGSLSGTQAGRLIIPSYQMRRGHPWLVGRELWDDILNLTPPDTLRTFIKRSTAHIQYVQVDSPSILQDLDTPEDYLNQRPLAGG
jgi:molybdenum cofactor cytidylyltransferase